MSTLAFNNLSWPEICHYINELPSSSPIPKLIFSHLKSHHEQINLGRIFLEGQRLKISQNQELDLTGRTRMILLFRAFTQSPNYKLSKEELIHQVYEETRGKDLSSRYVECVQHNLIKLLSRARSLVAQVATEIEGVPVDWFIFDHKDNIWRLVRVKAITA